MHLIMMSVGLGVMLLVSGVLSQGPEQPPEPTCDLVLGPAVTVSPDDQSQSFFDASGVKILRPDENTAILTGHIELLKTFKKNYMARVVIYKVKMGKKQIAFSYDICDVCAELDDPESQFKLELDTLGFPRDCPFDAGKFTIDNLTVDTEKFPVKPVNEGEYDTEICIFEALDEDCNEIDLQGCVLLAFSIECS